MILISKKNINRKFKTFSSLELSVERIEKEKNDMKKKKEDIFVIMIKDQKSL